MKNVGRNCETLAVNSTLCNLPSPVVRPKEQVWVVCVCQVVYECKWATHTHTQAECFLAFGEQQRENLLVVTAGHDWNCEDETQIWSCGALRLQSLLILQKKKKKHEEQRTHSVCKLKTDISFNDGNEKQSIQVLIYSRLPARTIFRA